MSDAHLVVLDVNDHEQELLVEARRTLVDVLRHDLHLTGTHVGCEHGVCGSCTVLIDGMPARACLVLAVQGEGHKIQTVESLGEVDRLSDLQQAFADHHGLQCGFCTPGFLMLAEGVLAATPDAEDTEIREALSANLCRCTGYQGIVDAVCATARTRRAQRLSSDPESVVPTSSAQENR